jgi:hypothetical protein
MYTLIQQLFNFSPSFEEHFKKSYLLDGNRLRDDSFFMRLVFEYPLI